MELACSSCLRFEASRDAALSARAREAEASAAGACGPLGGGPERNSLAGALGDTLLLGACVSYVVS
jgi:hypothetical protein